MPQNQFSIVDLVQGHSYAQRYQRKLAATGSPWQAGGPPAHTLSSSSWACTTSTSLGSSGGSARAANHAASSGSSCKASSMNSREDSLQHLARLTQQLANASSSHSLNGGNTSCQEGSQQDSIAYARGRPSQDTTRLPLADVLNQFDRSKSQKRASSGRTSHGSHPAPCYTPEGHHHDKAQAAGSLSTAASQQASMSEVAFLEAGSLPQPQHTQLNTLQAHQPPAHAAPAASQAGSASALWQTPASVTAPLAAAAAEDSSACGSDSTAADAAAAVPHVDGVTPYLDMPIVKTLVQCSGTGCEDVLEMCARARPASRVRQRETWVSRSFRGAAHSSCTLQLLHKTQSGVNIKVTFLDAASTPCEVTFAQTGSLRKAWEELGGMPLRRDDRQQLQHVFRLGPQHSIKRYLRISFSGHLMGQTSGLHSVQKLLVTAPAVSPARTSPLFMEDSLSFSLASVAEHPMQHHQTQQLQEQPTVSKPQPSAQHAHLTSTSEAAVAPLQGGTDATSACQQETAATLSANDYRAGGVDVHHDGMWGVSDNEAVDKPEVQEVAGRQSPSSTPLTTLGCRQREPNRFPHLEAMQHTTLFAVAAAKLYAIEVPSPFSCGSEAVQSHTTPLPVMPAKDQPRHTAGDTPNVTHTSSGGGRASSHEQSLHSCSSASGHLNYAQDASSPASSHRDALGQTASPEYAWDQLVDSDFPSTAGSPARHSSASEAASCSPSPSASKRASTWTVEQQPSQLTCDQPTLVTRQLENDVRPKVSLSAAAAAAVSAYAKQPLPSTHADQHTTTSSQLPAERSSLHHRPSSASQQLQQQLEQSQQQLLQAQRKHKQRISHAFSHVFSANPDEALPAASMQRHVPQQPNGVCVESTEMTMQPVLLPTVQSQPEAQGYGTSPESHTECGQHVPWQQPLPEASRQPKHAQSAQRGQWAQRAQHDLERQDTGAAQGQGPQRQGTARAAQGSGRGNKQLLMSSLDMDAYFGIVADDSSRQIVPADHMLETPHLPELLSHSGDLDEFSGLMPDPFAEGYIRAKADMVTVKSGLALPNLGKVPANLGEGLAKSNQTLCKPDGHLVPSIPGKRLARADSFQARVACATVPCVTKDAIETNQRSQQSDKLLGMPEKTASHIVTDTADAQLGGMQQPQLPTPVSITADAALHNTPISLAFASVRMSDSAVPTQGCVPSQQGQSGCVQEQQVRLHQSTAGGAAAATQPEAGTAVVTDADQPGVGHSKAEAAWPLMPHVPKLRHGQQLRQAAAEAAAVAAGQAAKAASAVQLQTPPTIAFNSKAARHAMAATEAATAAASLTGGPGQHAMSTSQEGFSDNYSGQGTRAGRLYASAPASPVKAGKHHSHRLLAVGGRCTGCSTDTAGVDPPPHVGIRSQSCSSSWQSPDAARLTSPASGSQLPPSGPQSPPSGPQSPVMPSQATRALLHAQAHSEQLSRLHQHHSQQSADSRHQLSKRLLHGQIVLLQHLVDQQQQQQHRLYQGVDGQLMPVGSQQGAPGGSELGSQLGPHWQLQEQEDPFKASAMFPVYAEVSSGMPLTDCTNQLPSIQGCQHMAKAQKSRPRRKHQLSRSTATHLSAATGSGSAFHAAVKSQHASVSQQTCTEAAEAQAVTAQRRLTRSASDAAALTSLSEADFWEAARADLTDTAEVARHRSRLHDACDGADSPMRTCQMSSFSDTVSQTPKAKMYLMLHSGITPLLDHGSSSRPCMHRVEVEDQDDPMKADWGL